MKRMLTGLLIALVAPAVTAQVQLQDNFDDNSLDGSLWMVRTDIPQGGASVVEQNQRVEITSRGHLITVEEFNPDHYDVLTITGEWTFTSASDFLQVLTRSDGVPSGSAGETNNGIEFHAWPEADLMEIQTRVNGVLTTLASAPITLAGNETFQFTITDDGEALSFRLQEVGGDGTDQTVIATSALDFAENHVVFHNRETLFGTSFTAFLDDVLITGTGQADVAVTKSAAPAQASAGDTVTYTLTATNAGATADAVTLSDALPAGVVFSALTAPAGWSCATPAVGASGTVNCSIAALEDAASATFTLQVMVQDGPTGSVVNTAMVATGTMDVDATNNSSSAGFERLATVVTPAAGARLVPASSTFALLLLLCAVGAVAGLRLRSRTGKMRA